MKNPVATLVLAGAMLAVCGCAGPPAAGLGLPGKTLLYAAGSPSFDIEVYPSAPAGRVEILVSIPPPSLTFLRHPQGFIACVDASLRAYDPGRRRMEADAAATDTALVPTYDETKATEPLVFSHALMLAPGQHTVAVTLTDLASGRSETRQQTVVVPSFASLHPILGRILIEYRNPAGRMVPFVPFHVPVGTPDLRASARLYGLQRGQVIRLRMEVQRLNTDERAASNPESLGPRYDPDEGTTYSMVPTQTVLASADTLVADSTTGIASLRLDGLEAGMYQVSVHVPLMLAPDGRDTVLRETRVLSVKPKGFPRPMTLGALVEAMVYLQTPKERALFRGAMDASRRQGLFDSLWLSFQPDHDRAADLLRTYYARVEEANQLFTDLREGWKTDRGMIYIIMGPPPEVSTSIDRVVWSYEVSSGAEPVNFVFRKTIVGTVDAGIATYLLYRDIRYERIWYVAVQRWRQGRAPR